MKARFATSVLVGICLATIAQSEETRIVREVLTSHGVRYRITGVNDSYSARPDYSGTISPPALGLEESLERCDSLVAAILELAAPAGAEAAFLREAEPLDRGRTWVDYLQRHQGYPIVGAGARLHLDIQGRIEFAGLQYEAETFPIFKPLKVAGLLEIAERAVPYLITGPPLQADLMIDPQGDSPARLFYFVVFPIRARARDSGWQVSVDAITGELISSQTTDVHAG